MNFNNKTKFLLFLVAITIIKTSEPGLADIWQATKNKASNAASWVSNKTSTAYNNAKNWVSNSAAAKTASNYSFNPRELADKAREVARPVTKYIPSVSQVSNKLVHQLDPVLIPKLNKDNKFKTTPAKLRLSLDLPTEEQLVLQKQKNYTKPALAKFLDTSLTPEQDLTIAFCGSGGGYRAMLSTVGFLTGAERIGLLPATNYMSALSGSTWALGPWTSLNMPINQFRAQLVGKTQNMLSLAGKEILPAPTGKQLSNLISILELKYLFHESVTSVDLWGAMIANKLFEPIPNRQNIYMSSQRQIIEDVNHIFPIYTAVNPVETLNYHWFEFTPYEAGCTDLKSFSPIWAFGRKFLNGESLSSSTTAGKQYAPEQTLGFYLGIFGSAFTVNLDEILDMMRKDEAVPDQDADELDVKIKIIDKIAKNLAGIKNIKQARISPAKVMNFTYGLASSPLKDQKKITLVDAGLAFNLPLPPLLRPERKIDVIFIFDSSADAGMAGELKKAEAYARKNNLPFPQIDYSLARTQVMSVFRDEHDVKIPTIIYLPLIKDAALPSIQKDARFASFDPKACIEKDYCSTFNFKYEPEEFETLTLLTEHNIADNSELIKETFQKILALKQG